jgi:mannose-6-phosphate isomerase-like protein (cupin superfamily)
VTIDDKNVQARLHQGAGGAYLWVTNPTNTVRQVKVGLAPGVGNYKSGEDEKHLDSSTILAYRNKDGKGELHEQAADVFVVLQGAAILVTGGTITNPVTTAPGEIRGAAVQQGSRKDLKEGDIAHIPAGVPHQVLVPRGGSFTYFVVKVPLR